MAIHLPSGSRRAIRQLALDPQQAPRQVEALLQVQLRVQQISHPHIVPVREVLRKDQQLFIVRDYVPGVSLQQFLTAVSPSQPLPPTLAGFIIWQLCQALYHAHHLAQQGKPAPLVHGALWPSNVLLNFGGELSLSDFCGNMVLRRLDEPRRRYLSPEQQQGAPASTRSDLYGVGLLLYELLAGEPLLPLAEASPGSDALATKLARVDSSMQQILGRCLQPAPGGRYGDLAALISELSVSIPGLSGAHTRDDLGTFIASHFTGEEEEDTDSIPRPAPLPGASGEEITGVTPADLADLLRQVSRHTAQGISQVAVLQQPVPSLAPDEDDGEATIVESPPLVQADAVLQNNPLATDDGEGPTEVVPASALGTPELTGEEATKTEPRPPAVLVPRPQVEDAPASRQAPLPPLPPAGRAAPSAQSSLPDHLTPLPQDGADANEPEESTTKRTRPFADFPRLPTPVPSPAPNLAPLELLAGIDLKADSEQQDTTPGNSGPQPLPASWPPPPPLPGQPPAPGVTLPPLDDSVVSSSFSDLTAQESPRALSLKLKQLSPIGSEQPETAAPPAPPPPATAAKPVASRPLTSLPMPSELPPERPHRPGRPAPHSPAPAILERTNLAGHELSASVSYDGQSFSMPRATPPRLRRFRPGAAHALLAVAILLFLFALGLLMRRIILTKVQPSATTTHAVEAALAPPDQGALQSTLAPAADAGVTVDSSASVDRGQLDDGAPAAALEPGQLQITSTPPGAVYVNHKPVGQSPATVRLRPGKTAKVHVEATGHVLYETVVNVPTDRGLQLQAQLREASYPRAEHKPRGVLTVRCRKKDPRRIRINGQDTGYSCPKVSFLLRPGRYKIGIYSIHRDKVWSFRTRVRHGRRTLLRIPPPR